MYRIASSSAIVCSPSAGGPGPSTTASGKDVPEAAMRRLDVQLVSFNGHIVHYVSCTWAIFRYFRMILFNLFYNILCSEL